MHANLVVCAWNLVAPHQKASHKPSCACYKVYLNHVTGWLAGWVVGLLCGWSVAIGWLVGWLNSWMVSFRFGGST